MENIYSVRGMHCASCVSLIQKKIAKLPGVAVVSVGLSSERATIGFTGDPLALEALNAAISSFGYALSAPGTTASATNAEAAAPGHSSREMNMALEMKFVIPMIIFSFAMMIWEALEKNNLVPAMPENAYEAAHHLMPIFAAFVLFGIGRRYIKAVWVFLETRTASMDTLVGISTMVAFIYSFAVTAFEKPLSRYMDVSSNFYDVVIVVIGLIALGQHLEAKAKRKTNEALQKLAELTSKSALVERDGKEMEVPIEQVVVGDIVIVKPNERIPIDGTILSGNSSIDESNLTGESIPADKSSGDTVFAGTQNFQGIIKITVGKDAADTALAHIIAIVEGAQNSKSPIERIADRISGIFVYVVIAVALVTLAAWLIFGPAPLGFASALALGISATMAVLVIACPCSLGLATPTAIITGVGAGARRGILIKNAESLERLAKVQAVVFDKTGTLTENKLSIEGIFCQDTDHVCGMEETRLKRSLAFSLSKASHHPVSQSVARWLAESETPDLAMQDLKEISGKGLNGTYEGVRYYLGSLDYITERLRVTGEAVRERFNSNRFMDGRAVYLANDNEVLSLIKLRDTIKPTAGQEIAKLKKLGLRIIMATGDNKNTGEAVARELGISEVFSDVQPADKLKIISDLQMHGLKVAMIGDGVNDSPALAQADVAISMSNGSDIAIESSDIILLNGDIAKAAEAISLARRTNRTIWQNLIWSFGYNSIGIPIAAGILYPFFGWTLSPAIAGALMAFESITVVANSLRLRNAKLYI